MATIFLDTSFLISFADPSRPNHGNALSYFHECVSKGHLMFISTIVASEFEVGQPIQDLPLSNFQISPFNLNHAIKSATLHKLISKINIDDESPRNVVKNDLQILAQAEVEEATIILTEDSNTMSKWCNKLNETGEIELAALLLKDGFHPDALTNPENRNLL